jgi:hypothetical protein
LAVFHIGDQLAQEEMKDAFKHLYTKDGDDGGDLDYLPRTVGGGLRTNAVFY